VAWRFIGAFMSSYVVFVDSYVVAMAADRCKLFERCSAFVLGGRQNFHSPECGEHAGLLASRDKSQRCIDI
jgi:hypothetical protein